MEIKLIFKIPSQCINLIVAQLNKSNFISFIICKPRINWHFAQRLVHLIDFSPNIDEQTSSPNDCMWLISNLFTSIVFVKCQKCIFFLFLGTKEINTEDHMYKFFLFNLGLK